MSNLDQVKMFGGPGPLYYGSTMASSREIGPIQGRRHQWWLHLGCSRRPRMAAARARAPPGRRVPPRRKLRCHGCLGVERRQGVHSLVGPHKIGGKMVELVVELLVELMVELMIELVKLVVEWRW